MAKHAPQRVQSGNRAYPHSIRPTAIALAVAACFSGPVLANPTNPTVVHGAATFATAGNILNITNSHNAIINWGSFSIGVNELTKFIQPSALSAVLNRVIGQDPSAILGALQSNGKVFLLNPNGIVFGSGAQINVAGLVASTLNLSNDDFLNNRMRFTDGAGAGSVVNNGSITGGSVYLVGNAVTNNGLITSPGGEVVLAAGNSVELVNPGTPNLRVEVVAPDNEARNLGTISAEAGRIGIYAGLITNSGTLNASSAVAEGGKILLKAKKDITLTSNSVLDASGQGGGEIIAFADNNMYVDGSLNASAPVSGNGGFIETSGKNRVKIADSAVVTTAALNGNAGTWLLDPADFIIGGPSGDISKTALESALGAGNVVVSTVSYGDSTFYGGAGGTEGDIYVSEAVSWNNANSLTLTAYRNVQVDQSITNSGTGDINLNAGWDMLSPAMTPNLTNSAGNILLNAAVSTGGNVALNAAGNITQGASAPITAQNLLAISNYGAVSLAASANLVNTLAGSANSSFAFNNSGALTVGTVGSVSGITVSANTASNAAINISASSITINAPVTAYGGDGSEGGAGGNAAITLAANNGITVNSNVRAYGGDGGGSFSGGGQGGAASVTLSNTGAANSIQVNSSAQVLAEGGEGGSAYGNGGAGGNATVALNSSGGLSINGSVRADGGEGGSGYMGNGGRGGDGVVNAMVSGALNIGAYGGVVGQGGEGGYASYGGGVAGRGGDGKVMMTAGSIMVASGQQVRGVGGQGGDGGSSYSYGGSAHGGRGGDGVVQLTANNGNMTLMSSVTAEGGWGGEGGEGGTPGNGGTAVVTLSSSGATTITDTYVYADGGESGNGGGSGGVGGNSLVQITAGGALTVSNSLLMASGGAGSGQGGAAGLTMIAGGNIQFEGAEGSVYGGGSNAVGGDAGILMQSLGGNIVLDSTYYSETLSAVGGGNTPGMKSVVVSAAGNVSLLNEATVYSSGTVGIFSGGNVSLDNAYLYAESSASVTATGSLSLANDSVIIGLGNAYIKTGGNVTVDGSGIVGSPDVFMTVGGVVNIDNGGAVVAGAPTTIHLTFPMLTSGGYFINGIEGVVFDPLTGTGFMADGSPAILGTNLLVTYGGFSNLTIPTDALIVAMGESSKPPDPEKDKDLFEDIKDNEKGAPVCR